MPDRLMIPVNFHQSFGYVAHAPELPPCGISALSINGLRNRVWRALGPERPFTLALNKRARAEYATRQALGAASRLAWPAPIAGERV